MWHLKIPRVEVKVSDKVLGVFSYKARARRHEQFAATAKAAEPVRH
jgi:hypothetical protein